MPLVEVPMNACIKPESSTGHVSDVCQKAAMLLFCHLITGYASHVFDRDAL